MLDNTYMASRGVIRFQNKIKIASAASAAGDKEKQGPLGSYIDIYCKGDMNQETWEKAESEMVRLAFQKAMDKLGVTDKNIDILLAGDLMNQCTGSGYGLADFDIPYIGLYGACSTLAEGLMLAAMMIDGGFVHTAGVCVSSHFCSAERQYRFPLEYGSFSGTTAQNTVTGSGAFLLCKATEEETGVFITEALPGIVCDRGIKDAGNMGAAMATAAADTILRYLSTSAQDFKDFDIIATGDLGKEGHAIAKELMEKQGVAPGDTFQDCGMLIYDLEHQDVGCGGSGCGCSAVCTAGYFYDNLQAGVFHDVAIIGTGAMLSPQSVQQGLSIPSVAHLVRLTAKL